MLFGFIGKKSLTVIYAVALWISGWFAFMEIMNVSFNGNEALYILIAGIIVTIFIAPGLLRFSARVSPERQRHMAFGFVLIERNLEKVDTFKVLTSAVSRQKKGLLEMWGIVSREGALSMAKKLSEAKVHTPFTDDVYNKIIKKNITFTQLEELSQEELKEALSVLKEENAYQSGRVLHGLQCYNEQKRILLQNGYPELDISQIKTLAAWDYGRTAYILRFSAHSGYLKPDEAWEHMEAAADKAVSAYDNWGQYFAAYYLGRALGYGMIEESDPAVKYSFLEKKPFGKIPFRG